MSDTNDKIRIVQETVAGKEITFAHVIGGPAPIIYQKLGLNPAIDYGAAAIGIMNMTPPESATYTWALPTALPARSSSRASWRTSPLP